MPAIYKKSCHLLFQNVNSFLHASLALFQWTIPSHHVIYFNQLEAVSIANGEMSDVDGPLFTLITPEAE
jgi:hypothetical protein